MAKKDKKKKDGGGSEIPEWVVTFGDMMSLLLCFFILLQMFSELKQDREYQRVVTAIKEAFGYNGGIGVLPIDDAPLRSMVESLETLAKLKDRKHDQQSSNTTPGMDGPDTKVTKIREGTVFTIGGRNTFAPYSAEITPGMRLELEKLAIMLAGRNNKIIVRGHASLKRFPGESEWASADVLSFARAEAVKAVLVELGLPEMVFRMEAVGNREPVKPRAVDPMESAENRRVEVIQSDQLVEDMNADWLATDPDVARGG